MSLADRIRKCAEMVGSANELARQSGVPRSTLETYLSGLAEPKALRLAAICKVSGVSGHWLLTGEGEIRVDTPAKLANEPKINIEALTKAFEVMMQTAAPGETHAQTAKKAVEFYLYLLNTGMITPDGVGSGNLANAA